ncbi:hypothetical protein HDU79_004471 [Rhizoclosmatium sp. JEL0117]|nr:hypothetical protein HDU79_004471 [Rhizoclosmatium sp. JEL0117]
MFGLTTTLRTTLSGFASFSSQLQQTRSITYKKTPGSQLPGYILPKQASKTSFYTKMLKMKFLRLRFGKQGQRARQPRYGRDDSILSKMNF